MLDMFQDLCHKWHPAPSFREGKASNLSEQYSAFPRRISDDRHWRCWTTNSSTACR